MNYFTKAVYFLAVFNVGAVAARAAAPADSCVECHRDWPELKRWKESVHAAVGVACPDCHGGDVTAFSMDAVRRTPGFVGKVPRRDIPALCARCHSDAERMKQYKLPFDQYEEYMTSVHGQRLAAGDANVAVCSDCHDAHLILKAEDTRSYVNKENIPATCNRCHGDKELMARYNLPADIYEKYAAGVHGRMLLKEKITGVPSCSDCHGNHGATPPGVAEVVNVCGNCHVNQREYYKESPHAAAQGGREVCVSCHSNHKIIPPDDTLYTGTQPGACGSCHTPGSREYKRAELIAASFAGAKDAAAEARARIEDARAETVPVELWEQQLKEAEAKITEAYPVAHSLSLDKVNTPLKEAIVGAHRVETEINRTFREHERRRQILITLLALVLLNISVLTAKRYLLFKELPE